MNRTFGISGFLAAGTVVLWVWFIVSLSLAGIYSSHSYSSATYIWLLWGGVSAFGAAVIFAFMRYSLNAHWAALRRNAPMPSAAWRGVCGIYLLVTLAFALPVLRGFQYGNRQAEKYFYISLAALGLVLTTIAFIRGFRRLT